MVIFRANHLQPDTLAVLNADYKDQYSKSSISWLNSFKISEIQHALNGGEMEIVGAKVMTKAQIQSTSFTVVIGRVALAATQTRNFQTL